MGTIFIAIGGPSGAGKTSVIKRIKELMPQSVITHPAFTTRPKRLDEQEGVDYYFRTDSDLAAARTDPTFGNFVEARGYWYWTVLTSASPAIVGHSRMVHITSISQRTEFEKRKLIIPGLRWIWLYADSQEIEMRLITRGDNDLAPSLEYNEKLNKQRTDDLIDICIHNRQGQLNLTAQQIIDFCNSLPEEL